MVNRFHKSQSNVNNSSVSLSSNSNDMGVREMCSLEISEVTGRRHDSILRDIRKLLSQGLAAHNFVASEYTDSSGRKLPCFNLTKKGCLILASGYNPILREKIIDRWESLEVGKQQPFHKQLSPSELILQLAQINVDTERKMKELEGKQNLLEAKVNDIAMRTSTVIEESTVIGFAKRYDIDMSRQKASSLGRAASCICTKRGYEMGRVNDPRFGYVKTYPDCILKEVFKQNYPHAKFG